MIQMCQILWLTKSLIQFHSPDAKYPKIQGFQATPEEVGESQVILGGARGLAEKNRQLLASAR